MRSRAFRRDAEQRKKEWAKKTFKHLYWNGMSEVHIGIRAHSPKTCSCQACGNPRKHWNQKTIQERRAPTY
jgi:hypothetical protein